jgi:hypothetical protein
MARVGCSPDLEILALFFKDPLSIHPDKHNAWEPYREPWIFAYHCPKPVDPARAQAQLDFMRMIPEIKTTQAKIYDAEDKQETLDEPR